MNLSDLLNISMGDVVLDMRKDPRRVRPLARIGATGEWDPRQSYGATGEWGPVSQNVEDLRPYSNEPVDSNLALPMTPSAPPPSTFRKESSQNPIDNPSVPVPSGTGMIRNTRTGKEYMLGGTASTQSLAPELDYARPVEVFGQGKGYYLKNDPMAAVVNGRRVDFGRDTGKELAMAVDKLKAEEGRQRLREGEVDIALKKQKMTAKPKAPPNYRWTEEGNLERIPGGAADEKVVNAFHADTLGMQSATASMDNLLLLANQVLNSPGLEGNYGIKGVFPNYPGGDAADAKVLLQRLKDVAGFAALNDLKSAGKNGSSGLGAVTEFEHKILQNQLANLDKAQSAAQARTEIANLIKATEAGKQRLSSHYRNVYGKMLDDSVPSSPNPPPIESNPSAPSTTESAGKTSFDTLPDPTGFEGRVIRDSHTGQRLKAVGGRWVPA